MIVNAEDAVLGRMASVVAKKLLNGEEVAILNAEKAVVSGNPVTSVEKYFKRRQIQQKANPEHSVKWPRRPDFLVKKVVKGMLPKKSKRGHEALKRLKCFIGVPAEFQGKPAETVSKTAKNLSTKYITVQQLCEKLGWNH